MRRILTLTAITAATLGLSGCLINQYSSDPNMRMVQLINQSEDLRTIENEWSRIWQNDHPSHLSPERVDGAIQPN